MKDAIEEQISEKSLKLTKNLTSLTKDEKSKMKLTIFVINSI